MECGVIIRNLLFGALLYIFALVLATVRTAYADEGILATCKPYREAVMQILGEEGVSHDYFFLMAAESRCRDNAVSDKGAQGFWQLMPATSKYYGCKDPHDLECATRAAARYIKHLQESFASFDEVVMAYNMGGHNFRRNGATREARGLVWLVRKLKESES